jgi:hypothetical protein
MGIAADRRRVAGPSPGLLCATAGLVCLSAKEIMAAGASSILQI